MMPTFFSPLFVIMTTYGDTSDDEVGNMTALSFQCFVLKLIALRWRHNEHDGVSNHQPHGCLLNRLSRRRSKKTSKLRVTGLCVGNSPGPVNSPHKGPVTRKMFPFDDAIMEKATDKVYILAYAPISLHKRCWNWTHISLLFCTSWLKSRTLC